MSVERGMIAAEHTVRQYSTGALGVLVLISILRLAILGWRDGGSPIE